MSQAAVGFSGQPFPEPSSAGGAVMDAHWPSDVLGGVALGAACANLVVIGFGF